MQYTFFSKCPPFHYTTPPHLEKILDPHNLTHIKVLTKNLNNNGKHKVCFWPNSERDPDFVSFSLWKLVCGFIKNGAGFEGI